MKSIRHMLSDKFSKCLLSFTRANQLVAVKRCGTVYVLDLSIQRGISIAGHVTPPNECEIFSGQFSEY